MKTIIKTILILSLCLFTLLPTQQINAINQYISPLPTVGETVVPFVDSDVRDQVLAAVNANLPIGVDPQVEVTTENILYVTNLLLVGAFQSISGLEYATNITTLRMTRVDNYTAPQTDITALAAMTQLDFLEITSSNVVDITPIGSLVNLIVLNISQNEVEDVSPLSTLTNLRVLGLNNNSIQDISSLGSIMPNLTQFSAILQSIEVTYSEPVVNGTFVFESLAKDSNGDLLIPQYASYTNSFDAPYITFSDIPSYAQAAGYQFISPLNAFRYSFSGMVTIGFTQNFAQEFLLSFDLNGGSGTLPSTQPLLEGALGIEPTAPSRVGYAFTGWNTAADGSGSTWDFANTTMPANNVTLYAQWDADLFDLVFDANDTTGTILNTQQVAYGALAQLELAPTRVGYAFTGWNTAADGSGSTWDFANTTMPANNVTLYAQWDADLFDLVFDANDTTGAILNTQQVAYGALAQPELAPTRVGYAFTGWNTAADGSGSTWDFANTTMPANNVTLYAQWDAATYEVVFELNELSRSIWSTQQVMFGDFVSEPLAPTLNGYEFLGWNTTQDGAGTPWNFETMTMPANNMTLYAQWEQVAAPVTEYTLTFDLNGGMGTTPMPQTLTEGSKAVEPTTPVRDGYKFVAWRTAINAAATTWDFETTTMPANDMTLYATWTKNELPNTGEGQFSNSILLSGVFIVLGSSFVAFNRKRTIK